jgi:hypothetical protein
MSAPLSSSLLAPAHVSMEEPQARPIIVTNCFTGCRHEWSQVHQKRGKIGVICDLFGCCLDNIISTMCCCYCINRCCVAYRRETVEFRDRPKGEQCLIEFCTLRPEVQFGGVD